MGQLQLWLIVSNREQNLKSDVYFIRKIKNLFLVSRIKNRKQFPWYWKTTLSFHFQQSHTVDKVALGAERNFGVSWFKRILRAAAFAGPTSRWQCSLSSTLQSIMLAQFAIPWPAKKQFLQSIRSWSQNSRHVCQAQSVSNNRSVWQSFRMLVQIESVHQVDEKDEDHCEKQEYIKVPGAWV